MGNGAWVRASVLECAGSTALWISDVHKARNANGPFEGESGVKPPQMFSMALRRLVR